MGLDSPAQQSLVATQACLALAEILRRVWGDGKILQTKFWTKISIFAAKIYDDDLFLVIDQVFRIFPFFSQIFRIFTMLYDQKNTFFTLSRASDNTTSQNIWGTDAWTVPPPQIFFWDRPPQSSLGLRPCCLE